MFKAAILANAQAIIFGHNHPSGDLEPSRADVEVTHRLARVRSLLGIPLLDSLIVSQHGYRQVDPDLSEKLHAAALPRDVDETPRRDPLSDDERKLLASASSVLGWIPNTRRLAGLSPEELRAEAESLQSDLAVHLKAASGSDRASPESRLPLDESREDLAQSLDALLSGSALERIGSALHAGSLLVQAYDLGRSAGGLIEWADLDAAFLAACDSLGLEPEFDSSFDETLDPEERDREKREVLRDMLLDGELDPDL